jgi:molybdenum cofactor synthesis domain-containing protein
MSFDPENSSHCNSIDTHGADKELVFRAGVITLSDKGFRGEREDKSGPLLTELLQAAGAIVEYEVILPDRRDRIVEKLLYCADELHLDLVVTTGGTGLAPTDVTPEATEEVISRFLPGVGEMMRMKGWEITPRACLSRGIAGVRGKTLIINFPGSPRAVRENFEIVRPILHHAISLIKDEVEDCASSPDRTSREKGKYVENRDLPGNF